MKKYLYIILSFSVCMFLLTLYLIGNANDKNKNIERGIDLYSTYDMNDLEILDDTYNDLSIIKVSNLKNSNVEEIINNKILDCYKELIDNEYNDSLSYEVTANFSNILSLNISGFNKIKEERKYYYLNINLNDGSVIKFDDLFVSNTDLLPIIHEAFLETSAKDNFLKESEINPGMLKYSSYVIDVHDRLAKFDEDKVNNATYKFYNSETKNFSIYADKVYIYDTTKSSNESKNDSLRGLIKYINYANEICLYNKYLSSRTLYSKVFNNFKKMPICVDFNNENYDLVEAGKIIDNLYVDFVSFNIDDLCNKYDEEYARKIELLNKKIIDETKDEIIKLKKTAKKDEKNMYIAFFSINSKPLEYKVENNKKVYANAISFEVYKKIYIIDRKAYDSSLYKELYLAYEQGINKTSNKTVKKYDVNDTDVYSKSNDIIYRCYNYITGKEIKTLKDMFINDSITIDDLKDEFIYAMEKDNFTKENIDKTINDGIDYYFLNNKILITSKLNKNFYVGLNYNDIDISCFTIYDDDIKEKYKEQDDYEINITSIVE